MSGESGLHVRLVRAAVAEIRHQHSQLYSLVLLIDLPESGRDRPPPIGGYVPDVYGIDAPETLRIIGEAKTPFDLETERSQRQIQAFLRHLSVFKNGAFFLAVPLYYRVRAQVLLATAVRLSGARAVTTHIVGG